jgi:mRNA interferase MazF
VTGSITPRPNDSESYVPERGDVVWLRFTPSEGHEQAGRRPALVLSPAAYNGRTGLMLACPITSRAKGYPFEVALPDAFAIHGVVLADQVRCIDWRARHASRIGLLPTDLTDAVAGRLLRLIE